MMKNRILQSIFLLSVLFPCGFLRASETELPTRSNILAVAQRVNDHWIINHPDCGNNLWARAAYFVGNVELYKVFPKEAYLNYATAWAEKNRWAINEGSATSNADNHACGQVYIDLFLLDGGRDFSKITGIRNAIDYRIAHNTASSDWWWVDALFMAMPTITRLGVVYDEAKYYDKLYALFHNTRDTLLVNPSWWTAALAEQYAAGPIVTCPDCGNATDGLYNPADGLWWRDYRYQTGIPLSDRPKITPSGNKIYWSRGNGWAIAALARTLQLLPADDAHRQEYIDVFIRMAEALKNCQREDGFWNMNLADAVYSAAPETSGTAFFAYGLAWGINNGFLDPDGYASVAAKAWNALTTTAIDPDGNVKYAQNVGDCPIDPAQLTITSVDFGVGAVLLAASELSKLAYDDGLPSFDESLNNNTLLSRTDWTIITSSEGPVDDAAAVGGNNPRYIIDGDINSAFLFVKPGKTYKGITVPSGVEPWFAIDLKETCEMSYMHYRHRDYDGNTAAHLRASKASFYGKNAETDEYQPIIENFAIATDNAEVRVNFSSKVSYRFVKMVMKEWNPSTGNTIQVSEFNLGATGTAAGTTGTTVAERATVYPNPAKDELFINRSNVPNAVKAENVEIYDIAGRTRTTDKWLNGKSINVSHLPAGVYIVKVGNYAERFIKL
jgi:rhamnogalacturonyl hydrolase YesR